MFIPEKGDVPTKSSYNIDANATETWNRDCDGLIEKPFSLKELSRRIRGILDKETTGTSTT